MPTQANWNLAALVLPEGDPMDAITELKSSATVIDLSRDEAEIHADLKRSLIAESRYDANGLSCDLKWTEDNGQRNPCDTCPHYRERTTETDAMAVLCRLGRSQNALLDELAAVKATERLDEALCAVYEDESAYVDDLVAALG